MAATSCILHQIHWPQAVEITWLCSCNVWDGGSLSALFCNIVSVAFSCQYARTVSWQRVSGQVLKAVISACCCVSGRRISVQYGGARCFGDIAFPIGGFAC